MWLSEGVGPHEYDSSNPVVERRVKGILSDYLAGKDPNATVRLDKKDKKGDGKPKSSKDCGR